MGNVSFLCISYLWFHLLIVALRHTCGRRQRSVVCFGQKQGYFAIKHQKHKLTKTITNPFRFKEDKCQMEFPPKSPGNIQHWTFDAAAAAPMLSSLPLFLFIVHCCCRCKRKLQLPHNLFNALLQMQCVLLCSSSSKQAGSSPWLVLLVHLLPGVHHHRKKMCPTPPAQGRVLKKSLVFCQTRGGARRGVKKQTSILEKYFFSEHEESF